MCGIAAYAGDQQATPFLAEALRRLEYRGYDSWGFVVGHPDGTFERRVGLGAPSSSFACQVPDLYKGTYGIGHVRWSTHGKPCIANAHPVAGGFCRETVPGGWTQDATCYVVHNGVITNYAALRRDLEREGYHFTTETDTEVIAHLFDRWSLARGSDPSLAARTLREVMNKLEGQYAIALVSIRFPGLVLLASRGSPLVISSNGYAASDASALAGYAYRCNTLADGEIAVLDGRMPQFFRENDRSGRILIDYCETVPPAPTEDTSGYSHSMHKEIHEQPALLRRVYGWNVLDSQKVKKPDRIVLFGCGSSYHAALLGRHYFENVAGIPSQAEYATELAAKPIFDIDHTLYFGLTQSGETRDTLTAIERLIKCGGRVFVLTNNSSSLATKLAVDVQLGCGPERGVAATKTFTSQVARLYDLAYTWADNSALAACEQIKKTGEAVASLLSKEGELKELARFVSKWHNILYLGRGCLYPVAMEGALKMKEVAYRHAEAMHASEMKHGPIALIDDNTLSIVLLTDHNADRVISNIQEIRARGGVVLAIADEVSAGKIHDLVEGNVLRLPALPYPYLQPILMAVALQLLSYHVAVGDGLDVDRPRNLAKSVTVE